MDIKPIKNCYYVSNGNKWDKFIFWFKLESVFYKLKYKKEYYAYPKYDIPVSINCIWWVSVGWSKLWSWGCFDISESLFIETISIWNRVAFSLLLKEMIYFISFSF
jgi:hypothetical protein